MSNQNETQADDGGASVVSVVELVGWVADLVEDLVDTTERIWSTYPNGDPEIAHVTALAVQRDIDHLHFILKSQSRRLFI